METVAEPQATPLNVTLPVPNPLPYSTVKVMLPLPLTSVGDVVETLSTLPVCVCVMRVAAALL